jgi:hypothetical protein
MLVGGRVVGTWKHLPRLSFHPFRRLALADARALRAEAARLAPHLW